MIPEQQNDVERFFRPWGEAPNVLENGFLPDIDTTYGRYCCPKTVRAEQAFASQCVVILGEPGIGKSTVMWKRRESLVEHAIVFDLADEPSDALLGHEALRDWQSGRRDLYLVIDSLDEASDPDFGRFLAGRLRKGPSERLRLEIACRAGEWPDVLDKQLAQCFSGKKVAKWLVEPLREKDIAAIAAAEGVSPSAFLDAVHGAGVGPLAAVPIMLELLITLFKQSQSLPRAKNDIYESASLALCSEWSATKPVAARRLDPNETRDGASAIAAICIFCHKSHISDSIIPGSGDAISIDELAAVVPDLSRRDVEEILRSGLFSPKGDGKTAWYHQSYAEYLAARWLHGTTLSDPQLEQILIHSSRVGGLVPQLAGLTAWLACLDTRVVRLLAQYNPGLLLSASSALVSDADRDLAASTLLSVLDASGVADWLDRTRARRLFHPGLARQLTGPLEDKTRHEQTRRWCLHIAERLGLIELEDVICRIAQDCTEAPEIRLDAVDAVFAIPGDRQKVGLFLIEVAVAARPGALELEFLCAVLEHVWQGYLSTGDFFALLPRPPAGIGGQRSRQLWFKLERSIQEDQLVAALDWLASNLPTAHAGRFFSLERFSTRVCRMAVERVDDPKIRLSLARVAIRALRSNWPLFLDLTSVGEKSNEAVPISRDARRQLVSAIASLSDSPSDGFEVTHRHGELPLVEAADIEWLLENWQSSTGAPREFFAKTVYYLAGLSGWHTSVLEPILGTMGDARESPLLPIPRWMDLDSDEAATAKENHREQIKWARRWADEDQRRRAADTVERAQRLAASLSGTPEDWIRFVHYASCGADWSKFGIVESAFLLSTLPSSTQQQLAHAAAKYLDARRTSACPVDHLVGYLSLRVLQSAESPELPRYLNLWGDSVVYWHTAYLEHENDQPIHRELLHRVIEIADTKVLCSLRRVLARDLRRDWAPPILAYLPNNLMVSDLLVAYLNAPRYSHRTRYLFEGLLANDRKRGLDWAAEQLSVSAAAKFDKKRVVATVLGAEGKPDSWSLVWQACTRDPKLGSAALPRSLSHFDEKTWGSGLSEAHLVAFYDWLETNVPLECTIPDLSQDRALRTRLIGLLISSGTHESLEGLEQLRDKYPDNVSLRRACALAAEAVRERSWTPLTLADFKSLTTRPDSRLVNSDEHLLGVILESLDEYELFLHAEPPAVADLWNDPDGIYRPKTENQFSNHLARFLKERLNHVVINREVEIRPTEVERAGQRIDLLIQATGALPEARVHSVIVEVKGSWNRALLTDIEDQLRDRYLGQGKHLCGVYVVGWFECSRWVRADKRCTATRQRDRENVAAALAAKAQTLQTDSRTIRVRILDATLGNPVAASDIGILNTRPDSTKKRPRRGRILKLASKKGAKR